jgi:hypothetical protein
LKLRTLGLVGVVAALGTGAAACASIWGFQDLSASGADAAPEAQASEASVLPEATAGDEVATSDASDEDATVTEDADAGSEDARSDAALDGGPSDAEMLSDAMRSCLMNCAGCCDDGGICQVGTSPAACGKATVCQKCPTGGACALPQYGPCCGKAQTCSCEPVTLCATLQ